MPRAHDLLGNLLYEIFLNLKSARIGLNQPWKLAKPQDAIGFVKKRDGLINEALELRRLRLCLDNFVATPEVKKNGLGTLDRTRLADTTRLVVEAFGLKNPVNATVMFNPLFMPPAAERSI